MRRRSNGEGSLYFNKTRKLWCAVTPHPRVYRYGKTQAEAKRRRDDVMKLRGQLGRSSSNDTVRTYLTRWLASHCGRVGPRTAERDSGLIRLHVMDVIGDVKLSKLGPSHIQKVIDGSVEKKHAPATTNEIRSLLSRAFNVARKFRHIAANPVDDTDPRKRSRHRAKVQSRDESKAFIAKAKKDRDAALLLLYALVGPRRGEPLGLMWSATRLTGEEPQLTFTHQVQRIDGKLRLVELKTDAATGTVRLPKIIVRALKARRTQQLKDRMKAGAAWIESDLVFTTATGTMREPRNVYRKIKAMTGHGVHRLRHTAASMLLAMKVPITEVSAILRHANPGITLRIYSHLIPGMQTGSTDAMDEWAE